MENKDKKDMCGLCDVEMCQGKTLYQCKECGCKFCDECGHIEQELCSDCFTFDVEIQKEQEKEISHDVEEISQEQD